MRHTTPKGYDLNQVRIASKGRGQYVISAELRRGVIRLHSTDSMLFDEYSNADIDTAKGRNVLINILNMVIRSTY